MTMLNLTGKSINEVKETIKRIEDGLEWWANYAEINLIDPSDVIKPEWIDQAHEAYDYLALLEFESNKTAVSTTIHYNAYID